MPEKRITPPRQRYSLRADIAAWLAVIRGLKDNPWLIYLRLTEQRRLQRLPAWRRSPFIWSLVASMGVWLLYTACTYSNGYGNALNKLKDDAIPLGLVIFLILFLAEQRRLWRTPVLRRFLPVLYLAWGASLWLLCIILNDHWYYDLLRNPSRVPACIIIILWFAIYVTYTIFQSAMGALSLLGRRMRGFYQFALDQSAALTGLSDQELAVGAIAALLPPLIRLVAAGSVLLAVLPCWILFKPEASIMAYASDLLYSSDWVTTASSPFATEILRMLPLALGSFAMGVAAAVALIMWHICLGRGLNLERIGLAACGLAAISQVICPWLYYIAIHEDRRDYLYTFFMDVDHVIPVACMFALFALAPVLIALLLNSARHAPWLRIALAILSPLMLCCIPLLIFISADVPYHADISLLNNPLPFAMVLPAAGLAILAPHINMFSIWAGSDAAVVILPIMLLTQLCSLYILSRFTIEAISMQRREGD